MKTRCLLRFTFSLCGLVLLFALTSCATYSPSSELTGLSSDLVIQRMGTPSRKFTDDNGFRLVYVRGPFGKHTYFLYFSPDDKLLRSEQVLKESFFSLIKPGMSEEEVLNIIGPSKILMGGGISSWTVWSYRYENSLCRWFQVEFRSDHRVKSAEYGRPPECNVRAPRGIGR
jgi:hypothetical protein